MPTQGLQQFSPSSPASPSFLFLLNHSHQHKNPLLNPLPLQVFQFTYLFPFTVKLLESLLHSAVFNSTPSLLFEPTPVRLQLLPFHQNCSSGGHSLLTLMLPDPMVNSQVFIFLIDWHYLMLITFSHPRETFFLSDSRELHFLVFLFLLAISFQSLAEFYYLAGFSCWKFWRAQTPLTSCLIKFSHG